MSMITALYEGHGVMRFAPVGPAAVKPQARYPGHDTTTRAVARPPLSLGTHRTRRGAIQVLIGAIWNVVRTAGAWIEEKSRQAHYRRIENYLAQSSNHADLERRMRELDRSNRLNWIDCGIR